MEGFSLFWNILSLLLVNTYSQQLNNSGLSTYYNIVSISNVTDLSNVARTFDQTWSVIECGVKCSELASVSFYFLKQFSTCHCSNHHGHTIAPSNETGTIKYGYIEGDSFSTTTTISTTYVSMPCNLSADWIAFQRRLDGSTDFFRNWTEYVNGFGNPNGEFWLGLETIHQMTVGGCVLCIYLEAGPNSYSTQESGYARYSYFKVGDASTNYRLIIRGFSGTVADSFVYHNGSSFSTYDRDNDVNGSGCATQYKGAWWYNGCHYTNLNGVYLGGEHNRLGESIEWSDPWGHTFSLLKTVMAFRC